MILNRDCCGNGFRTISLAPGTYDYLAVQLERGGGSSIEPTIDLTPDGLGRRTLQPGQMGGLFTIADIVQAPTQYHLIKNGSGTLLLTGDNDYDGETLVTDGTLLIDGTTSGQGNYTVNSGATLGGNGTIGLASGNSVIVEPGGILSPGTSIGTLTVDGDVDLDGTLLIEVDGLTGMIDLLAVTGTLDITGATVDFDVSGTLSAPAYVFGSYGTLVGDPFAVEVDLPGGYMIDYAYEGDQIALVIGIIPEPATIAIWSLLAALGMGCGWYRRKK